MRQNMSQTELADRMGVDKQYLCRIEKGSVNMSFCYLDRVIRCLGCGHHEFFATMPLNTAIHA